MNTRGKGILFSLSAIVAAAATASSSIAWCFANQTHQQITEVAYAYLKAASQCKFTANPKAGSFSAGNWLQSPDPCKVVDIAAGKYAGSQPGCQTCFERQKAKCKTPAYSGEPDSETDVYSYMFSCAANSDLQQCYARSSSQAFNDCVTNFCANGGPLHRSSAQECNAKGDWKDKCQGQGGNNYCLPPSFSTAPALTVSNAYTPASAKSDLKTELCFSLAYTSMHTAPDPACNYFGSAFLGDTEGLAALTTDQAKAAVTFLQNFVDTTCPDSDTWASHDSAVKKCIDNKWNLGPKAISTLPYAMHTNKTRSDSPPIGIDPKKAAEDYSQMRGGAGPFLDQRLVNPKDKDLTGSILGFRAGITDSLDDLWVQWVWFPIIEDTIKFMATLITVVGGDVLITAGLIAGAALCASLCVATLGFFCEDCFDKDYSWAQDLYDLVDKGVEKIHSSHWLAGGDSTTVLGHETSPLYHFMSDGSTFDDKDGLDFQDSQPNDHGSFVVGLVDWWQELAPLTPLTLGVQGIVWLATGYGPSMPRVNWKKSRRSIDNYQIHYSKDRMADSLYTGKYPGRDAYYWDTTNVTDAIFAPADNMAYYWWFKWLYARKKDYLTCKPGQPYGLYPLGIAIHAVQDMATKYHAANMLGANHSQYESWISANFNLYDKDCQDQSTVNQTIALKSKCALNIFREDEMAFFARVNKYLRRLNTKAYDKASKILSVRELAHEVQKINTEFYDQRGDMWGETYKVAHAREVALPLGVAATVLMIREGAGGDPNNYSFAINQIASFQNRGPVPPLTENADDPGPEYTCTNTHSLTPVNAAGATALASAQSSLAETPGIKFAAEQPRVQAIAQAYVDGTKTGADLLHVAIEEQIRGDALSEGRAEPEPADLSAMADAKVAEMRANLAFQQDGSLPKRRQKTACAKLLNPPAALPDVERPALQSICDGTADSDGDGIPDLVDDCWTSADLIQAGKTVQANGCVFQHQAPLQPRVSNIMPGTVSVGN